MNTKTEKGNTVKLSNGERNRRLKLGIAALALVVVAYALAKITGDESGDWWRFSLLTVGLVLFTGGYLTITDVVALRWGK